MSTADTEREYQSRAWRAAPATAQSRVAWAQQIAGPGKVEQGLIEIKPHTESGRRAGEAQLRRRAGQYPGARTLWLVTYQALGGDGRPLARGTAPRINVWAERFENGRLTGRTYDLGPIVLPSTLAFPRVDLPGFFGMAVEEPIRTHVSRLLQARGRTLDPRSGGAADLPDVLWNELAAMYRELAGELRDPFYAELAAEFGRLADEVGRAA